MAPIVTVSMVKPGFTWLAYRGNSLYMTVSENYLHLALPSDEVKFYEKSGDGPGVFRISTETITYTGEIWTYHQINSTLHVFASVQFATGRELVSHVSRRPRRRTRW